MSYICAYAKSTGGILQNQAALAAGVTVEYPLPRTWSLIGDIRVTVQGESSGDAVTNINMRDMIQEFRILTTKGTEVRMNGYDLSKWSGWVMHGNNKIAPQRIGAADDQEAAITYLYPLGIGPQKWQNGDGTFFGLPGHMADRLIIQFDDDVELDGKQVTIEYDGLIGGPMPYTYQCLDVFSYTAAAVAQVNDISLPTDAILRGVFGWTATEFDTDTAAITLSTGEVAIVKNQTVVLQTNPLSRQFGMQNLQTNDNVSTDEGGRLSLESGCHWFWDLDYGEGGHGYKIDKDTSIRITAAIAEAARIHRVYYSLVPQ